MTTVKELITNHISKDSYIIGCWDDKMEKLKGKDLELVISRSEEDYTDVIVKIGRSIHVVEIGTVDGEKDFSVLTKSEYINRYGSEKFE